MKIRKKILMALLFSFPLFGCSPNGGSVQNEESFHRKIMLREPINLSWTAEWITESFEAPAGACHPESIRLEGPDGPVPAQLINVEKWPGTPFVRSAELIYVTDIDPLQKLEFTLSYGPEPVSDVPSDLTIKKLDDHIELANDVFGIRLFLGERTYSVAESSDNVPGPVAGVRLADGAWTGGSRLYGSGKIRSVSSYIIEQGPAIARIKMIYEYEDGRTMTLTAQLSARAPRSEWDMFVEPYNPEEASTLVLGAGWDQAAREAAETAASDGWQWLIDPNFDDIALAVEMNSVPARNRWGEPEKGPRARGGRYDYEGFDLTPHIVNLAHEPEGELMLWMPWAAFHQTRQSFVNFTRTDDTEARAEELQFAVLNPGEWMEPLEPGTWASYMNVRLRHKSVPLIRGEDGAIFFQFNTSSGNRYWQVGIPDHLEPEDRWREGYRLHGVARRIATRHATWSLNKIKDLTLEWVDEDPLEPYEPKPPDDIDPEALAERLQIGAGWVYSNLSYRDRSAIEVYRMSGRAPEVAEMLRLVDRLGYFLHHLGNLDRWRYGTRALLPQLYDEVMRSGLADEQQRSLFRSQMALLGYIMDDPGDWSPERGWTSGNLNMTIYNIQTLAHIASRIPGHPMASRWGTPAAVWAEQLLENHVGPKGEFVGAGESLTHYAWGTASSIRSNADLARKAGGPDLVTDPRMKKMIRFFAKIVTPPDPRPHKFHPLPRSVTPPVGRGTSYNAPSLFADMAREIADTDPELASELWWAWKRANPGKRAEMPYRTPQWTSEFFPKTGVILRHGLDTSREHYAFFVLEDSRVAYASESGAFAAIWANGVPIATRFGGRGYEEREDILISRVIPAWNPGDRDQRYTRFLHDGPREVVHTSFLPRQDYFQAELNLNKSAARHHGGVAEIPKWPIMEQEAELPVKWQRQVLFVKGPDASEPSYYVFRDTVAGDQPTRWQYWTISEKIGTPAQVADIHGFLADKPGNQMQDARELEGDRFTAIGQYGVDIEYYIASPQETPRHTLRWGVEHAHYTQYQDLMHLQMPGNGAYFVAMFPRMRKDSAPEFSTAGNGFVIRVDGEFGTDHIFLSETETETSVDGIHFSGTAASVQNRRNGGQVLSLADAGKIELENGISLSSDDAVSLSTGRLMVVLVQDGMEKERLVRLRKPGGLSLINPMPGVKLDWSGDEASLTLPAGVNQVMILANE